MLIGTMTNRRSNATNAYDLMTDIKKYIPEEPKRVWMDDWIIRDMRLIKEKFDVKGPVRGTVGCIAGNVAILTGAAGLLSRDDIWDYAERLLSGGNETLRTRLSLLFLNTEVEAKYGTRKYAQIVAKRIGDLQKEYKASLRAVEVVPARPSTKEKRK